MRDRRSSTARGYGYRWQKARKPYLLLHPECVYCKRRGLDVEATIVDHIKPRESHPELAWDTSNWQSLCQHCHDSVKQAEEANGKVRGVGVDGIPIDSTHGWR